MAERPLLANITEATLQQQNIPPQQGKGDAGANYLQQQYNSAVMNDAISAHADFMQRQAAALHGQGGSPNRVGKQSNPPRGRKSRGANRRGTTGDSPQKVPHCYSSDPSNPCPCADCNVLAFQQAMAEASAHNSPLMGESHESFDAHNAAMVANAGLPSGPQSEVQSPVYATRGPEFAMHDPMYAPMHHGSPVIDPTMYAPPMWEGHDHMGMHYNPAGQPIVPGMYANPHVASAPQRTPKTSRRGSPLMVQTSPTQSAPHPVQSPLAQLQQQPPSPQQPQQAQAQPAQTQSTKRARRQAPAASNQPSQQAMEALRAKAVARLRVRTSQWHVVTVAAEHALDVGTFVALEGDRGVDVGRVEAVVEQTENDDTTLPLVLHVAAPYEVEELAKLEADAAAAVPVCEAAVAAHNLNMRIVGAVFQFDREKLTFLYDATDRVDFRQLVRELYGEFRCRIWMELVPTADEAEEK